MQTNPQASTRTKRQPAAQKPTAEPDIVDRIFAYLESDLSTFSAEKLAIAKEAVRAEFGGTEAYIRKRAQEPTGVAREVLCLFNGRNATEIARRLGIGRSTVYLYLKQAGHKNSPKLP